MLHQPFDPKPSAPPQTNVFFSYGFRPFFLLAGIFSPLLLLEWLAVYTGTLPAPRWLVPFWWHGHEMVFGFIAAVIAGFLLTAVPNWTNTTRTHGLPLVLLVVLWLAGRIAMLFVNVLPLALVAIVDLAFFPALALTLAPRILAARRARNYGFPIILLGFFACNLLMHLNANDIRVPNSEIFHAGFGLRFAVYLSILLVAILGGRVIPSFTVNGLLRQGKHVKAYSLPGSEELALPSLLLFFALDLISPRSAVAGSAAAICAVVLLARMAGWQTRHTLRDSLIWSLHLGFLWIPIGLSMLAASYLFGLMPPNSGLHALTVGCIGTITLSMMSRVALGHTGRMLIAPRAMTYAYLLATSAGLVRSIGIALFPDPKATLHILVCAGALWIAAFLIFVATFFPILTRPRLDGKPG